MEDISTLEGYLQKHNPMALKDAKNKILHFKDYNDAYLYALKEIRLYCKRGYIELALLVKHLTQFDDDTCFDLESLMQKNNKSLMAKPLLLDWHNVGYEKEKLQTIVSVLHEPSGSTYDWTSFEYAWLVFRQFNENENAKEEKESLQT